MKIYHSTALVMLAGIEPAFSGLLGWSLPKLDDSARALLNGTRGWNRTNDLFDVNEAFHH